VRVVIDTNVLLAALPRVSIYRPIINSIASGSLELVVSTAILLEYQEILSKKANEIVANNFLEFLLKMPGVIRVGTPFTWGVIEVDPDDNKFVDAGFMGGADYIITYDKHFEVVSKRLFPHIDIIDPDDFLTLLAIDR
jgi:uncharacterized protein